MSSSPILNLGRSLKTLVKDKMAPWSQIRGGGRLCPLRVPGLIGLRRIFGQTAEKREDGKWKEHPKNPKIWSRGSWGLVFGPIIAQKKGYEGKQKTPPRSQKWAQKSKTAKFGRQEIWRENFEAASAAQLARDTGRNTASFRSENVPNKFSKMGSKMPPPVLFFTLMWQMWHFPKMTKVAVDMNEI